MSQFHRNGWVSLNRNRWINLNRNGWVSLARIYNNDIGKTRINTALYPFGHGLSYTKFEYSDLIIVPDITSSDFDSISISFKIRNIGEFAGDEIPQLYIQDEYSSVVTYEKLLRGFERITLKPNEEKEITFSIHQKDLELLNKNMIRVVEPGKFLIFIGSSSEDIRLNGVLNIP